MLEYLLRNENLFFQGSWQKKGEKRGRKIAMKKKEKKVDEMKYLIYLFSRAELFFKKIFFKNIFVLKNAPQSKQV